MIKILYSFDSRNSSKLTFNSINLHLKNKYKLISASYSEDFDINLLPLTYQTCNAYKKNINNKNFPLINYNKLIDLIEYIKFINPDLIISDNEYIIPYIGNLLEIEVASISFLNIIKYYKPNRGNLFYSKFINHYNDKLLKFNFINYSYSFVYSNFYIYNSFNDNNINWMSTFDNEYINDNCEMTSIINNRGKITNVCNKFNKLINLNPWQINNSNIFITSGENQIISNIIKFNKSCQINIIPTFSDLETLISALIIRQLNLGLDLGEADVNDEFCLDRINNIVEQNKYYYNELLLQSKDYKISYKRNLIADIPEPNINKNYVLNKPNLLDFLKEKYE